MTFPLRGVLKNCHKHSLQHPYMKNSRPLWIIDKKQIKDLDPYILKAYGPEFVLVQLEKLTINKTRDLQCFQLGLLLFQSALGMLNSCFRFHVPQPPWQIVKTAFVLVPTLQLLFKIRFRAVQKTIATCPSAVQSHYQFLYIPLPCTTALTGYFVCQALNLVKLYSLFWYQWNQKL